MQICIYLLLCPITGEVRYVGKTAGDLRTRLKSHIAEAKRRNLGHRGAWIRSLIASGLEPVLVKDVDVPDGSWQEVERERIAFHRAAGCDLVNGTEGGDGLHMPSAEVRSRMSESARRRSTTPEGIAHLRECARKVGLGHKGKKKLPRVGAAVAASNRLRVVSEETIMKMSAARKGRKFSDEHRRKISEAKLRFEARQRELRT